MEAYLLNSTFYFVNYVESRDFKAHCDLVKCGRIDVEFALHHDELQRPEPRLALVT
jgi:hypothetical protein